MKTLIIAMVLVIAVAAGAMAVTTGTATLDLYPRANQICPSLIPFNPIPLDFSTQNPSGTFNTWMELLDADWLKRLEPTTQSEQQYFIEWQPPSGMLAGEGYIAWTQYDTPGSDVVRSFSYDGVDISDTDLYISLPGLASGGGGSHWIGMTYPKDKIINYFDIVVTDGSQSYTMLDIYTGENGAPSDWINPTFIYLDPTSQSEYGLPDEGPGADLYGGQAYRVQTLKSNLALIIKHPV
jgi:hypothetical protein